VKEFLISLVSFTLVAAVVWGVILAVVTGMGILEGWGLPAPLGWIGVGVAVAVCRPGKAILDLSSYVWTKVDAIFWRWS